MSSGLPGLVAYLGSNVGEALAPDVNRRPDAPSGIESQRLSRGKRSIRFRYAHRDNLDLRVVSEVLRPSTP